MREAEPLAGRLRWGGAGQPAGSQRAEPSGRRGPGQAGRQGRWALGRVLPLAVPRWPPQPLPLLQQPLPSLGFQGQAREKQQRLRPPGVGRFREGGPSRLRVRASSDRASPALSHRDSARPGQAHPPPHPASRARVGNGRLNRGLRFCPWGRSLRRSPSPVRPGLSGSHRQLPPRPQSPPGPARPRPRPRPRSRGPAPRDSPAAGEQARAHLPPTPPAAKPGTAPPGPAPARDATGAWDLRLRRHAPFPPPPPPPPRVAPPPPFLPHFTAALRNLR